MIRQSGSDQGRGECPTCGGTGTIYHYVTPYRRVGRSCPTCRSLISKPASSRADPVATLSSRAAKQPLLFILIAFVCLMSCAFAYVNIDYLLKHDGWEPPWLGMFIFFLTIITCIVATVSSVVVVATLVRRFNLYR